MTFRQDYRALTRKFKERVERDNEELLQGKIPSYYLPNIAPKSPVDYVLVTMEPSSNARLDDGSKTTPKNFALTIDDFIFHYCVQKYLCGDGRSYHITDIAKGAMKTDQAKETRAKRWRKWYPLLEEELKLVAKQGSKIVALGSAVERFLIKNGRNPDGAVLHYSKNSAVARTIMPQMLRDKYDEFSPEVSIADIVAIAERVMKAAVFDHYRDKILDDLRKVGLSESSKMLMFTHKCQFGIILGNLTIELAEK